MVFRVGDINLEKWPFLIFATIQFALDGLEDVLNKFLLTEKYMLPHVLMFLRGLYTLGMTIVFTIIIKFSGFEFTFSSNYNILLLSSFLIIFFLFHNLFDIFINYTFTPQHLSFSNMLYYIVIFLLYRISRHNSDIIIICELIIDLFLTFSTLIFSEMVIINKWGLNNNTRMDLLNKEKQELDDENRVSELML